MTVDVLVRTKTFAGNDATTSFPCNFVVLAATDLSVTLVESDDTETVLTLDVDYSLSGLGFGDEAEIEYPLVGSPLATGDSLCVERQTTLLQPLDLVAGNAFNAENIEQAFDRQMLALQDLQGLALSEALTDSIVIGANAQPYSAKLLALANLQWTAGKMIQLDGTETLSTRDVSTRPDNANSLATASGSLGAYAISSTYPVTSYVTNQEYEFIANHSSVGSGADTLNVDGVGAVVLKKTFPGSTSKVDLAARDITAGRVIRVKYDGTNFVVVQGLNQIGTEIHLGRQTPTDVASVEFADFDAALFDGYKVKIRNIRPVTDGVQLMSQSSSTGGAPYDGGASDYAWALSHQLAGGSLAGASDAAHTSVILTPNAQLCGNAATENASGEITLWRPDQGQVRMDYVFSYFNTSGVFVRSAGSGVRLSASAVTAFAVSYNSGNVASGIFDFYGVLKA